jgi:magnesium-transporting ATPase (P-type)
VETLGSVTTICSDKTGTLTRNEMTVTTVMLPGHDTVSVTGIGYDPVGDFRKADNGDILHISEDDQLARIIKAASLCTDAYLERDEESNQWHIVGDTTEGALIVMARKQGWSRESLEQDMPRVNEIPFTSERKSMTTFHKPTGKFANVLFDNANFVAFIKGAPDNLMEWANVITEPMTPEIRAQLGPAVLTYLGGATGLDLGAWRRACLASAGRAALVVACDVAEALEALLRMRGVDYELTDEQRLSVLREIPEDIDMLRFAVSDEYFALRRSLGLALRSG